jgi:hypothetical protein
MEKLRRKSMRTLKEASPTKKSRGKPRFHGEVEFKKDMACVLSVAGYTRKQIAAALGESVATIQVWAADPKFQERYLAVTGALTHSALTLLQSYAIEAVQTLAVLMRTAQDDATILKAVQEILDRGGLPKMARVETTPSDPTPKPPTEDDEEEKAFRRLTPEQQEVVLRKRDQLDAELKKLLEEANAASPDS